MKSVANLMRVRGRRATITRIASGDGTGTGVGSAELPNRRLRKARKARRQVLGKSPFDIVVQGDRDKGRPCHRVFTVLFEACRTVGHLCRESRTPSCCSGCLVHTESLPDCLCQFSNLPVSFSKGLDLLEGSPVRNSIGGICLYFLEC